MNVNISEFFQEALHHSRRQNVMKSFLRTIDINTFHGASFDDIFWHVWRRRPQGINKLGVYDITSKIFKHFGGTISVIYLVGNGPIDQVRKLGLDDKVKRRVVKRVSLYYIEIEDVLPFIKDKYTGSLQDGDSIESFLCVMHKL